MRDEFSIREMKGKIESMNKSIKYYEDLISGLKLQRKIYQLDIEEWENINGPAGDPIPPRSYPY